MNKLFGFDVLDIAYSMLHKAPKNSMEHFRYASDCGYTVLKGDLQLTSDGGLVLCHDDGLTLNGAGRIVKFDKSNYRDFSGLTFSECIGREHEAFHEEFGYYAKLISFEEYIRFCKENGKIAYITARGRMIPQVVAELFRILRLYDMERSAVVNSFAYDTLTEVRRFSDAVPISNVQPYKTAVLEIETVRRIMELGNSIVTLFCFGSPVPTAFSAVEQSHAALTFARENGVSTHMAIVSKAEDYRKLVASGFTGVQLYDVFPPYTRPEENTDGR